MHLNNPQTTPRTAADTWDLDDLVPLEEETEGTPSVDRLWTTACDEEYDEDGDEPWLYPDDDDDTIEIPGRDPAQEDSSTAMVERGPAEPTWFPDLEGGVFELPGSALSSIV